MTTDRPHKDDLPMDADERRIAALAREVYRAPPPAPREEMWSAIAARRSAPVRLLDRRGSPWWMAAAASALLAAGVGIGMWVSGRTPDASVQRVTAVDPNVVLPNPFPTEPSESAVDPSTAEPGATRSATPSSRTPPGERPGVRSGIQASAGAYRLVALSHLAQTEVLLTEYSVRSRAGDRPELATWARDLLSSTRLLLDSPAGADARLRHLLEDLELVLAQIVQHEVGTSAALEDDFVERALRERAILAKLRAAVPAGAHVSGS